MYTLTYTKSAVKDIPKLKSAKLDTKAKALLESKSLPNTAKV